MRYSDLFGKTKRDAPSAIPDPIVKLAFRAGLVRAAANEQWLYLPLASIVISRMLDRLKPALSRLGAQELCGVSRVDLGALAASEIQSYKHLPARVYWYGEAMTRLHLAGYETTPAAAATARAMFEQLAVDFFAQSGLQFSAAADAGNAQIWYTASPALDLQVLKSNAGSYAATRAAASPLKNASGPEELLELRQVATPHCDTIESLATFLNVPTSRTAKAVFYASADRLVFGVIRGDLQIDEDKVKRILGLDSLRWATDDEIARVGATPGYASPVGIRGVTLLADDSIIHSPNLVAGANKPGFHLLNTNVPRDYQPDIVADIALAKQGDPSPDGQGALELVRGIALGRVSGPDTLDANYLDQNGKAQQVHTASLELDLGAALLAHVAAHHDERGILWSHALAPYDVHIVALNADKPDVAAALGKLTDLLDALDLRYLQDDRSDSAGIKFNDADLIGVPLRITVGPKTVAQDSLELKPRSDATARVVPLETARSEIAHWMELS